MVRPLYGEDLAFEAWSPRSARRCSGAPVGERFQMVSSVTVICPRGFRMSLALTPTRGSLVYM